MSVRDNLLRVAAISADIKTVGQGKAALGVAADTLQQAYKTLQDGKLDDDDVRQAIRSLIDSANAYAQKVYAAINAEGPSIDAQLLTVNEARQVAGAITISYKALKNVEEEANTQYWEFGDALTESIRKAGEYAGTGIAAVLQTTTNSVVAGGWALLTGAWLFWLIGGLVLWFLWSKGYLTKALEVAT